MGSLDQSAKVAWSLVEFRYGAPGAPTYLRVTDLDDDVDCYVGLFTSLPSMEVALPQVTGVLDDKPLTISVDRAAATLFQDLTSGQPHSPVFVTVYEYVLGGSVNQGSIYKVFSGRLARALRNADQHTNFVKLEAVTQKGRLKIAQGIVANHQCPWSFGGEGCGVAVTTGVGVCAALNGSVATITGLGAQPDRFWHRGFVERDGLRIMIREWVSGTAFALTRRPPASWVGQNVTVSAGCDKTIETCRNRWNNEANFGGAGYAMPDHNPNYEVS